MAERFAIVTGASSKSIINPEKNIPMTSIIVAQYDPHWPDLFEMLRRSIWPAVADVATVIEHVGSTSVPGLAAKPVIDMDVVVPDDSVAKAIERLTTLGYEHRGDLGIPHREAFTPPPEFPRHHLYVCPKSSPALANHLAVRDYLRKNHAAVREYGELKRQLARRFANDIDEYVEGKTEFLLQILRDSGFASQSLGEIMTMNRRCHGVLLSTQTTHPTACRCR